MILLCFPKMSVVGILSRRQPGRDRFCWPKVSEDFWSQSNIFQSWWELSVCQRNLQPSSLEIFSLGNTNSDFAIYLLDLKCNLKKFRQMGKYLLQLNRYLYYWIEANTFVFEPFTILAGCQNIPTTDTLRLTSCFRLANSYWSHHQLKPDNIHQTISIIIPCVNKNANSSPDLVVFAPQIIIQFIKDPSPSLLQRGIG